MHLDSRFSSETEGNFRNSAERAFAAVVTCAIDEKADLLLIVGDLFDNNRVGEADFEFVRTSLLDSIVKPYCCQATTTFMMKSLFGIGWKSLLQEVMYMRF